MPSGPANPEPDYISLLVAYGDNLERAIRNEPRGELLPILDPYSEIWGKYVLPNRTPTAESAKGHFRQFAGNHYSALIRLQNASVFKDRIDAICCEKCEGKELLAIQADTAAFWWSLGAVIDNLGQAIQNFPGIDLAANPDDTDEHAQSRGKKYICGVVEHLDYIYNRRTQQIHSRIIPIGTIGGYPHVDPQYFDGPHKTALPKYTDWREEYNNPQDLAKEYDEQWQKALKAMLHTWNHMRCLFADTAKKAKDKKPTFGPLKFSDIPPVNFPVTSMRGGSYVSVAQSGFGPPTRIDTEIAREILRLQQVKKS
jgi:hypothetical protein